MEVSYIGWDIASSEGNFSREYASRSCPASGYVAKQPEGEASYRATISRENEKNLNVIKNFSFLKKLVWKIQIDKYILQLPVEVRDLEWWG